MKRLTKKIRDDFYTAPNIGSTDDLKYKLGKLEDLEEELGCPLEVLLKLRNQQYFFLNDKKYRILNICFEINTKPYIEYYFRNDYLKLELVENYKKNWWLNENKSE